MENLENLALSWTVCNECHGVGKKSRRLKKKDRVRYQMLLAQYEKTNGEGQAPLRPKGHLELCSNCGGSGLVQSANPQKPDALTLPNVAIIGAGIGGVALAVACLHRGIPFTIFERDDDFEARSQGYGLTLQQASKAIASFGIFSLEDSVISTRHVVHTTDGNIIGEWGMRKWQEMDTASPPKRTNIHIARQSLRLALLEQLGGHKRIQWGHQLVNLEQSKAEGVVLGFEVNGKVIKTKADLVVGSDGIRSAVRRLSFGKHNSPLNYLDCMVILGICPLSALTAIESTLLDAATVFQTANGNERIYMMPYTSDSVMWQLSFPISEKAAKTLSKKGAKALKLEACRRTQWHDPIPQILAATLETQISGYPVYDRELLKPEFLATAEAVTLIGDAAHPMSPFKGQGANQALLDALALARGISKGCRSVSHWRSIGIRESVLNEFELEMIERSASKVTDSAAAAQFLHSDIVLHEGDEPRGRFLKRKPL